MTDSTNAPSSQHGRWLLATLIAMAVVLLATMPGWIYVGDAMAMRRATEQLLRTGTLSVPAQTAGDYGEPGQYFFRNERGEYFSKYGWFNSLVYVPPVAMDLFTGEPNADDAPGGQSDRRRHYLNLFNLAASLAIVYYLFSAAALYAEDSRHAAVFVVMTLLCTFAWNYLRAHTVELFQLLFFTASFVHFVRSSRNSERKSEENTDTGDAVWSQRDELLGWAFLAALCWGKSIYVLLLPIAFCFRLLAADQRGRRAAVAALAITITMGVIFAANWRCFDSPLATGYTQWQRETQLFAWRVDAGALGFVLDPRKSVPLHFPAAIVAAVLTPFWLRLFGREASYPLATLAVMWLANGAFVNWRGDWCYGPRYLLFALPVVSLPVLYLWRAEGRRVLGPARGVLLAVVVLASLWSLRNQMYVNSLEFFAPFRAEEIYAGANDGPPAGAFARPYWVINREILRAKKSGEPSFESRRDGGSESRAESLRAVTPLNYHWLK
ncbi:MAG: hypothetical protein QGG36_21900 [Pirellulaceae bacterium]|nr:hypothetical protein [Pirellulaceae bacterium]